jgi:malonyl-CoA O-methyltransferase
MPESRRIAAAFHQQAVEYDRHVLVQKRVVAQLAASVAFHLKRAPERILDVGTGTGALLERLHSCYPDAALTGVDIALNMCLRARHKLGNNCQVVCGAAEALPFRSGAFDLAVSASVLQWVEDLPGALRELRRVVRPGGDISLAFFCEGSLGELRHCFGDAVSGGVKTARLHRFWTVDEVKTIVGAMDFEKVVVSVETEVDWYADVSALLRAIRNIGAGTVSGGAGSGLGWRGVLQETARLYRERYEVNGRIPATYKVLNLTAAVAA